MTVTIALAAAAGLICGLLLGRLRARPLEAAAFTRGYGAGNAEGWTRGRDSMVASDTELSRAHARMARLNDRAQLSASRAKSLAEQVRQLNTAIACAYTEKDMRACWEAACAWKMVSHATFTTQGHPNYPIWILQYNDKAYGAKRGAT